MIHVALLRGINVGGNRRVPMADLRRVMTDLGYEGVTTYINSGNVLFETKRADHLAMANTIEDALEGEFGFRCRVLVRSGTDVVAIAKAIPEHWGDRTQRTGDVAYLLDGLDPKEVAKALGPREGIDNVVYARGALLWSVERKDLNRNGLQRLVGTPYYQQATVRNVNTARKLAALVEDRKA